MTMVMAVKGVPTSMGVVVDWKKGIKMRWISISLELLFQATHLHGRTVIKVIVVAFLAIPLVVSLFIVVVMNGV